MRFVEVNAAAVASLGYSAEELLDMGPAEICPEKDIAALEVRLDAIRAGESASVVIHTQERRKDGQLISVEWHVSRIGRGDVEQWIVVARKLSLAREESNGLGALGHDPLTELPNRLLFERRLERSLQRTQEDPDYRFAVCFIDLDRFKAINDNIGHLAGDRVLREVACRLVGCVRPGDTVARFGGDEFTVLIDGLHHDADAEAVARRILLRLNKPMMVNRQSFQIAASIGVATGSRSYRRVEDLLHDADRAMYRAKASGGDDWMVFSDDETSFRSVRPR
jgi:diguanylate cyclase (GGDEF)-like protein/PAS domain S-box-containing protein